MSTPTSTWLPFLPAELRGDPILGGFLVAFERILSGHTGHWAQTRYADDPLPDAPGIEERLAAIGSLFAPRPGQPAADRTPPEFLSWLANLLSVPLREEFSEETRRRFIRAALPSYSRRGTKQGLIDTVGRYLGDPADVRVFEFEDEPHFFQVEVVVRQKGTGVLARIDRVVRALIDQVRPAHTWYSVRYLVPTMQLVDAPDEEGEGIVLGRNTLIGTRTS